ncbi:hypothetical protein FB451DRAFT_1173342 [Mycena latifolia]|nr:hypothetical protein FB451DRAFT_1173342 [Mycena latifolia]
MCRTHCLESGGCLCHREDPPAPSYKLPDLTGASLDAFNAIREYSDTVPRSIKLIEEQERKLKAELEARLPQVMSPSPTPSFSRFCSRSPAPAPSAHTPSTNTALAKAAKRSFVLVNWAKNNHPAIVEGIQDFPSWPFWSYDTRSSYQCYNTDYSTWVTLKHNYVHELKAGEALFIRSLGVVGSDEDAQFRRLLTDPDAPWPWSSAPTAHTWREKNLLTAVAVDKGEVARMRGKRGSEVIEIVGSSEDEHDRTKKHQRVSGKQRSGSSEPEIVAENWAASRHSKRPRLTVTIPRSPVPSQPSMSYSVLTAPSTSLPASPGSRSFSSFLTPDDTLDGFA